ncbi:MAG: hypothetical protein GDA50_07640 [Alphaproteobacteria bacterium GM202ARS2]|nr:hypothetical protein [Alphaproteobacteria bacterium GM202ARS2]
MEKPISWLRIDERTDVLASLSLCLKTLDMVTDEPAQWKWAILSIHNALQGAMVCHLSGTADVGALTDKCAKEWWSWHDRDGRGKIKRIDTGIGALGIQEARFASKTDHPPDEILADTKTLFKRLYKADKRVEGGAGAELIVDETSRRSFYRLHDLRRNFAHFTPKAWSIEIDGLPQIFEHMLGILRNIASDPWPFRHMDEEEKTKLDVLLSELQNTTRRLKDLLI